MLLLQPSLLAPMASGLPNTQPLFTQPSRHTLRVSVCYHPSPMTVLHSKYASPILRATAAWRPARLGPPLRRAAGKTSQAGCSAVPPSPAEFARRPLRPQCTISALHLAKHEGCLRKS
ncbi:MAG: hypothetical protein J3K34DRAFT_418825 [Monoraphidium minutum]|nr:MAG: hypothetical protein J3K34DRAFT_418825 [Monoraphidium minutum]